MNYYTYYITIIDACINLNNINTIIALPTTSALQMWFKYVLMNRNTFGPRNGVKLSTALSNLYILNRGINTIRYVLGFVP